MGQAAQNMDVPDTAEVRAAQGRLNEAQQAWVDIGIEAGLLVASSSPVGGQIADGISLSRNVAAGNYGAALVDGIGFIPLGGDLIKGFFRGRRIRRAMRAADNALGAARDGLTRAQTFARRRMAASQYWQQIKRRRDEIAERYRRCNSEVCREARRRELEQTTRLPSRQHGEWRNTDGSPALPGQGKFIPNEGTRLHDALSEHQSPVTGITYRDGNPDFSDFPPLGRGNSAPDGSSHTVEIEQALGPDPSANRTSDRNAAWGQWRQSNPNARRDPNGGVWHHTGDGVTMQYVDADVHSAAHQGSASMNTSPEF